MASGIPTPGFARSILPAAPLSTCRADGQPCSSASFSVRASASAKKSWYHYDDALDTFGVHAVGGTLGAFLTGVLATATVNSNLVGTAATQNGLAKIVGHMLWLEQLKAIGITIALAVIGTSVIGLIVRATIGLRITPEIERQGLDINLHGEEGYIVSG